MSETKVRHSYSWLSVFLIVMMVVMLALGAAVFHYVEKNMVETEGEALAIRAAEVSDRLDRYLFERYGDAKMMAGTFSVQPHNRESQSAYFAP